MGIGKIIGLVIGGLFVLTIVFAAIDLGTGYFGVFYTKTVGKAQENAKREVFKQTQVYNDGMAQELVKLKGEIEKETDPAAKNALLFTLRHDFANFDESKLESQDLRDWLITNRGF